MKLNTNNILSCKALIDSYIYHGKYFFENNMLREYNELKTEMKNPNNALEYTI